MFHVKHLRGISMGFSKTKIELMVTFLDARAPGWVKVMSPLDGSAWCRLQVGFGADVEAPHATLGMFETIWFSKMSHAEIVFEQCLVVMGSEPDAPISKPAGEVRDCIVNVSADLGAVWQSTADVVADAAREVDEIERQVEALNRSGGLQPLNKKYKTYRLAMQKTGGLVTSYSSYLHIFKLKVAKMVGNNVAAGTGKYAGLAMVAPTLISTVDTAVRDLPVLKNTTPDLIEKHYHTPLHHTRNDVHKQRRLRT